MLNVKSYSRADTRLQQLESQCKGEVVLPEDAGYDAARLCWNLTIDQRPAVIVVAQAAGDVAAAVRFANQEQLAIAVKTTGHGVVLPADDCLLIVMSQMNGVSVDPIRRTAWVDGGAQWLPVLEAAQAHGLTPLLGSGSRVGAVGYTLGGGMGWMARRYGLAADNVRTFQVVLADGREVRASASDHADLFWALRGGGGSFGIVTAMEITLFPVATFYAGNLFYPLAQAKAVFQRFREWTAVAPEEATLGVVVMHYPPIPDIPEFLSGKSFVQVHGAICGSEAQGAELLKFWRDWQPPVVDDFKMVPTLASDMISMDPIDPVPGVSTGAWLADLSDETIDTLLAHAVPVAGPPTFLKVEVRHAGGAISRVDPAASAYSHRDAQFVMQAVGICPTAEAKQGVLAANDALKADLRDHLSGAVYMNFLEGHEAHEHTPHGYETAKLQRLRQVKQQYDPDDRFCRHYNIRP